jgi:hypothetical protein
MSTNPAFIESAFKELMGELRRNNGLLELVSDQLTLLTAYTANGEKINELDSPEVSLFSEVHLRQTLVGLFEKIAEDRAKLNLKA